MYLEYYEYQEFGGQLEEIAFNNLEYEAEMIVDWYTFNRLHNQDDYPDAVKRCMYIIIQLVEKEQNTFNLGPDSSNGSVTGAIKSQSNDGVSISYNVISAADAFTLCEDEIKKKINHYLQGVTNSMGRKLLYRGVYPDE